MTHMTQHRTTRRTLLRTGVAAGTATALAAGNSFSSEIAMHPDPVPISAK